MKLTRLKNIAYATGEKTGLVNLLQKINRGTGQYVYVLAYHRVEDPNANSWLDPYDISATPQQFEAQMKLLSQRYHPVSIADVLNAARGGQTLPTDAVLLTVDDGYRNFKETLFPICQRYGIPPLLFVPTGFVGSGTFWWDKVYQILHLSGQKEIDTPIGRLSLQNGQERTAATRQLVRALKRMPRDQAASWIDATHASLVKFPANQPADTLTWDELRTLQSQGVAIAPHTHTHPILSQISLEEVKSQVCMSRDLIRQELGDVPPVFAIPDGKAISCNEEIINMIHAQGFEIIFLLSGGRALIQPGSQKMVLPRLAVWRKLTLAHFHTRLTPLIDKIPN